MILDLMTSLLQGHVNVPMWMFLIGCTLFTKIPISKHRAALPFAELFKVLFQYIVIYEATFIEDPKRLEACIDVCQIALMCQIGWWRWFYEQRERLKAHGMRFTSMSRCIALWVPLPTLINVALYHLAKHVQYGWGVQEHMLVLLIEAVWCYKGATICGLRHIRRYRPE